MVFVFTILHKPQMGEVLLKNKILSFFIALEFTFYAVVAHGPQFSSLDAENSHILEIRSKNTIWVKRTAK